MYVLPLPVPAPDICTWYVALLPSLFSYGFLYAFGRENQTVAIKCPFFAVELKTKSWTYVLRIISKNVLMNPEQAITTAKVHHSITVVFPGTFTIGQYCSSNFNENGCYLHWFK